jgi:hypothetical protein
MSDIQTPNIEQLTEELRATLSSLLEVEDEIKAIEYAKEELRAKALELTTALGGKVHIDHLASVQIIPASEGHTYDPKALDSLVDTMIADGEIHNAKRIITCRKESKRKASMRITRAK